MVRVVATSSVKEGCQDQFVQAMQALVKSTNELDAGCISYELFRDLKNPLQFAMIEMWESQEDLDNHLASAHFKEIIPSVRDYVSAPTEIATYEKV